MRFIGQKETLAGHVNDNGTAIYRRAAGVVDSVGKGFITSCFGTVVGGTGQSFVVKLVVLTIAQVIASPITQILHIARGQPRGGTCVVRRSAILKNHVIATPQGIWGSRKGVYTGVVAGIGSGIGSVQIALRLSYTIIQNSRGICPRTSAKLTTAHKQPN